MMQAVKILRKANKNCEIRTTKFCAKFLCFHSKNASVVIVTTNLKITLYSPDFEDENDILVDQIYDCRSNVIVLKKSLICKIFQCMGRVGGLKVLVDVMAQCD